MVDFRKWFPALAIVALLLGSAVTASAQPAFTCSVTAGVPPLVRAEGITELVGDIVLNCTGGNVTPGGQPVPGVNVTVFLNTNITSRLIDSSSNSEALLLIDEPNSVGGQPLSICTPSGGFTCPLTVIGTGAAGAVGPPTIPGGVRYGMGGIPNGFVGRWGGSSSPNTVTWTGVPIDAPGTIGTRVIRITNIRANANQLGVSSTLVPSQIVAFVSITSTQPLALSNPQQIVGFVTRGLSFSVQAGPDTDSPFLQCIANNADLASDSSDGVTTPGGVSFRGRFTEGFASSFKRRSWVPGDLTADSDGSFGAGVLRNCPGGTCGTYDADLLNTGTLTQTQAIPGQNVFTESGFVPLLTPSTSIGVADHGTRLMLRLSNVPAGVRIYAGLYEQGATDATSRVRLVSTDSAGAGTASAVSGTSSGTPALAPVSISGGAGTIVYEVVSSDPAIVESIDVPIVVAFAANAASLGTASVVGSFAPISSVTTASSSAPIPRFADVPTSGTAFVINPCRTNLLFPFVTNQAGFDTGIAISNTSQDIFGTTGQSGPCRINYFGQTTGGGAAPNAQTTSAAIPAGGQLTFVVSTGGTSGIVGTPGFQGYIIAQCDFQYAHGFAFVTDGPIGAARVAEGYLALVMDDKLSSRTGYLSESLDN